MIFPEVKILFVSSNKMSQFSQAWKFVLVSGPSEGKRMEEDLQQGLDAIPLKFHALHSVKKT